jgi:hypothetical protein
LFYLYELDDTPRVAAEYLVINSQFEKVPHIKEEKTSMKVINFSVITGCANTIIYLWKKG